MRARPVRQAQQPSQDQGDMRAEDAPLIRLEDYRPSDWLIDTVDLDIVLDPKRTKVRSQLQLRAELEQAESQLLALYG